MKEGLRITHPVKRRCSKCGEIKNIPIDLDDPICDECYEKQQEFRKKYIKILALILIILMFSFIYYIARF